MADYFQGLFFNNVRWGPGVQSHANLHEDVGLWRAGQLVRLAWKPDGPSIAPDLVTTNTGKQIVESNRIMLTTVVETVECWLMTSSHISTIEKNANEYLPFLLTLLLPSTPSTN